MRLARYSATSRPPSRHLSQPHLRLYLPTCRSFKPPFETCKMQKLAGSNDTDHKVEEVIAEEIKIKETSDPPVESCKMQTIAGSNDTDHKVEEVIAEEIRIKEASDPPPQLLSKSAQKRILKQQKYEAKKAEKKAAMKEQRKKQVETKRREWDEKLLSLSEEERLQLLESRKGMRKERMDKRSEERRNKVERLTKAKEDGLNIVIDLEFSDRMATNEIHSLVQQVMYCYAVNGRSSIPAHLWLTSCEGETGKQLQNLPGYDKWIIDKDSRPYIQTFEQRKEQLVYLTADSDNILNELDSEKIYIVGGLVDRNRWKGITMEKAQQQMIQTAKLPIGTFLKMSGSQVLTVNQVMEILLKYLETRDWKDAFFHVIPQRKRVEASASAPNDDEDDDDNLANVLEQDDDESDSYDHETKRQCIS